MTAYTDFTRDFPGRCLEVLDSASADAVAKGREITLLFMAASASLLVPFERLKPDTSNSVHPFRDNKRYCAAATQLEALLGESFVASALYPGSHSFEIAKNVKSVQGDPDGWLPTAGLIQLDQSEKVDAILRLIRNALAHGNIYTDGDPIKKLIFVTEIRDKKRVPKGSPVEFDVIRVGYKDFQEFVRAWVAFLQSSGR